MDGEMEVIETGKKGIERRKKERIKKKKGENKTIKK